jgi:hypothetical protein
MTREQLLQYIESRINYATNYNNGPDTQKNYFAQAFGALDFYLTVHSKEYDELSVIWETYRQRFNHIIYGV